MELKQHLLPKLKQLRLAGILDTLEARLRQATNEQWSHSDFLERLLEDDAEGGTPPTKATRGAPAAGGPRQ